MQVPLKVTFRNMDHSGAVERRVKQKAAELEQYFDRITSCQVVVEAAHKHHHKGFLYDVRIHIEVPSRTIVVNRNGPKNHAHEDVYVAMRDAFRAAARQLEDHARTARGEVKTHEVPDHGIVAHLAGEEGYGFIQDMEGREIYFHRNSVVEGSFDDLAVGDRVRIVVAHGESEKGPQASTVRPMGKHHLVG